MNDFRTLYEKTGYIFKDESLLLRALTHSSVSASNYERLEFLGDSIVNYAVSRMLFEDAALTPGDLTERRKETVSKKPLAYLAKQLGLVAMCKKNCAFSEKKESDLYESVTGAIALDGGLDEAIAFVRRTIVLAPGALFRDYKSEIKERCEKNKWQYVASHTEIGTDNNRTFSVEVRIDGIFFGAARGKTIAEAEQAACRVALEKTGKQ